MSDDAKLAALFAYIIGRIKIDADGGLAPGLDDWDRDLYAQACRVIKFLTFIPSDVDDVLVHSLAHAAEELLDEPYRDASDFLKAKAALTRNRLAAL